MGAMQQDHLTLDDLAERLGVHRSNARKIALGLGHIPTRRQVRGQGHHQRVLVWTPRQVEEIVEERRRTGFEVVR
jgi:hypothetical protein